MVFPDSSKHFTKFGKFPPNFNNVMVFSSCMKRSFLYNHLLSTLAFVMVVLDGTWLSLTQANILPILVNDYSILFFCLLLLHEEVLLVHFPVLHLSLCDGCFSWDLVVLDHSKNVVKFGRFPHNLTILRFSPPI